MTSYHPVDALPHEAPTTVTWVRVLLLVLAAASLVQPYWWYQFLPPDWFSVVIVAVIAVPSLLPLTFALLARRRSRIVFAGILLTALGFLIWSLANVGAPLDIMPELPVQFGVSLAVLVLLLRPNSRAHYLGREDAD